MKRIKFNEIIECSSQQSILSGQAGFGIRTITEGFNPELARKICDEISCAYEVDIAEQVTTEQITTDPSCVTQYPRTLKYQVVKNDDGKELYVIACATYVGIDYGYFCDIESARRAGSNYIADILVFDEKPTAGLFHALIEQKIFRPIDNTCVPNNPELQKLLTGEPNYLSPRELEIKGSTEEVPDINEQTALVAMALLQTKVNQDLGKDNGLVNIVFQAQEAKVSSILQSISALPNDLVSDKFFHTNFLQGYGMPNGYRMMFLNEHNKEQVYVENYVYLNLDENKSLNLDTDNFYFGKIKEAAAVNNYALFYNLVNYLFHLSVQADTDYKFLYNLFIATETEKKLSIEEMTEDFFTKAKKANLCSDKWQRFVISVNNTLNETIQKEKVSAQADASCNAAMKVVTFLYNNWKEVLYLDEESKQSLTDLWHQDRSLARYTKTYGIEVIQSINTKDVSPNDFIETMKQVDDPNAWKRFADEQLEAYEELFTDRDINDETIIDTILSSVIADKNALIARFFPIPEEADTLMRYVLSHPMQMEALEPTIKKLCDGEQLSSLIEYLKACQFNSPGLQVMERIIKDYFTDILNGKKNDIGDKDAIMKFFITQVVSFSRNVPVNRYRDLGISQLVKTYAEYSFKHPRKADKQSIKYFLELELPKGIIDEQDRNIFGFIIDLSDNPTDYMGTYRELLVAKRLGCPMNEVRMKIIEKLFTDRAKEHKALDAIHIKEYFTDPYSDNLPEKTKEESKMVLDMLWDSFRNDTSTCEKITPVIIEAAQWTSKERKEYQEKCKNDKEKAFITKYYSFWVSLIRKLFKKK